jgi:integrase
VADLVERWRAVVRLTRRPRTAADYARLMDRHVLPRFGQGEPRGITRNAVEAWHGDIAARTPIEGNRALAVLSSFCSWLQHDRLIEHNPCKGIKRRPENQRHVFLDADEIAAAHKALKADRDRGAALALRLALLTGCRIGEALSLTAGQVDLKRALWIKPSSTTKTKRLHIVPLQRDALAVVGELLEIGVPDHDRCRRVWERVRKTLGRPEVRIHDLRHSRASALARNGASLLQIGRVLGHTAPATTARYAHLIDRDLVDLVERS